MRIHKVDQKSPEWFELRAGKITGTDLKKLLGGAVMRDNYLYEYIAERLSDGLSDENILERANRLEEEAVEKFEKKTGKIVERIGLCESSDNEFIACSPDGLIKVKGKYREALEVKCLMGGNYVRAWLSDEIPKEHKAQAVQYFIVNPDLQTLHFVLYNPQISIHPIHIIKVSRKELEPLISEYRVKQEQFLEEVEERLTIILK